MPYRRLCLGLVLVFASCASASAPPPAPAGSTGTSTTAPAVVAAPTQPATPPAPACQTDADCHVVSDYCGGCRCWAGPTSAEPDACAEGQVMCFVDPCRGARPVCEAGRCAAQR